MNVKLLIKFLVVLVGCNVTLSGQYYSFSQHVNYADESFAVGDYLLAMEHYDKAIELNKNVNSKIIYNYAEAAYKTYSLKLAESLFKRYLEMDPPSGQNLVLFKLAHLRQLQGRYEESILDYNIYLSEYEDVDSLLSKEVHFLKASAQWAIDAQIESIVDSVSRLSDTINSPFSEYAPFEFNDKIYYNSLRIPKEVDNKTKYHSKIFVDNQVVSIDGAAEQRLVSHPSFSSDGKFMLYTIGDYVDNENISCHIYFSFVSEEGSIGGARKMSDAVNQLGSTSTHPMMVVLDSTYMLYFVSDRKGGEGGMDLYAAELSKLMEVQNVQNMKELNTSRDEMSPFFHDRTNSLYFSSNGREGYGGFDIYKASELGSDELEITNLGNIINSPNNDLFYFVNQNGEKALFSSNRPGSSYLEDKYETCCYDIYEAEIKECDVDLLLLAFDKLTGDKLDGAHVQIVHRNSEKEVYGETSETNLFEVDLECEEIYTITATKLGYHDAQISFEATNVVYGGANEVTRKLYLEPAIFDLNVSVYDLDFKYPLDSLDIILKNLSTNEVVEVLSLPTNTHTFKLIPNTEYEITVRRRGYIDTVEKFDSGNGGGPMNKDIYLKEIEVIRIAKLSLANAIPVALYFDHDQPGRGTMQEVSPENFTKAYYKYYNKRANYVERYANRFGGRKKDDALFNINSFFENEVKVGFDKYEVFKNQLILVLQSGQKVNIYLRGYTSPIAPSEYNIALGKRRIDSVHKEFHEWGRGALLPYIESGQLRVTERSFGEETSPIDLSDDPRLPAESIYSPSASKERRVEIDEINFNQDK